MDIISIIKDLERRFSEPAHVTTFRGYKDNEEVIIEIWDHGPDFHAPQYRYFCKATMADGRQACGNGGATPHEALDCVHWQELDRPKPE